MSEKIKPSSFEFKAIKDGDEVYIEGYANTSSVDDVNDKMGYEDGAVDLRRFEKNPIMFFNHNRELPIGKWLKWKITEKGLWLKGIISKSTDPLVSYIRDLVAEGILKTLSIGFDPKEENFDRQGKFNYISKWRLNEVSIVTMPANIEAEFSMVKSFFEAKSYDEAKSIILNSRRKDMDVKQDPEVPPTEEKPVDQEKPMDEEKTPTEAFQQCVSNKIPKLLEEGRTREQAIAVAMSMCREEGKCSIDILTKEMFEFAGTVADNFKKVPCDTTDEEKPPKKDTEEKAQPETITTTIGQTSDDPSNFGSPQMDMMKTGIALLGKISTQLDKVNATLENLRQVETQDNLENNNNEPPVSTEMAKEAEEIKSICNRLDSIVKEIGV